MLYTNEAILATLLQQLEIFLSDASETHIWIHVYKGINSSKELTGSLGCLDDRDDVVRVYVRKSQRGSSGKNPEITCLDIGSILIQKPYRGKGLFSTFVPEAHRLHPYRMTYIQSIHNPLVEQWCRKHGWDLDPDCYPSSFSLTKKGYLEAQSSQI